MHKYGRLIIGIVAVAIVAVFLYQYANVAFQNKAIATGITAVLVLALLVMLYGTRYWGWRAVGVFFVISGTALFYGWIAGQLWGWFGLLDSYEAATARALLAVGAVLMAFGLFEWLHHEKPGKRSDPLNGEDEVL